jgi:hypothetical protein
MIARSFLISAAALACVALSVGDSAAQRFGGAAGGGMGAGMGGARTGNPAMGSIHYNGMAPVTAQSMMNPGRANLGMMGTGAQMGSIHYGQNFNNQGLQPSDLRVPFTYSPGYQAYWNRMPYGYWNYSFGGVPYYWYNSFWYRSMWYRGMPYYIPVPVNTVPDPVQNQWTTWSQTPQGKKQLEMMKQQAEKEKKAEKKKDDNG